jgi:hypothetical protein
MSSFNDYLDKQIQRDFTKHGWRRVSEGQTAFYERPLSTGTYERMIHPKKVTILGRSWKGVMDRLLVRFIGEILIVKEVVLTFANRLFKRSDV